jgi:hypothetical protein
MHLVSDEAAAVRVVELEFDREVYRRKATIRDKERLDALKAVRLERCRTSDVDCRMSARRVFLTASHSDGSSAEYEVRSGIVYRGAEVVGCLPDGASKTLADTLSGRRRVRVDPLANLIA